MVFAASKTAPKIGPRHCPRGPQERPKTLQEGSKTARDSHKTHSERPQAASKGSQENPNIGRRFP
eukprot:2118409-Pyramimonas_sp.AAC.1